MPGRDLLLELLDVLFDVDLGDGVDFSELQESLKLVEFLERLAALLEQVVGVVNVCLLEQLVLFLLLCVVFLVLVLHLGAIDFVFVLSLGLLTLLILDQFVDLANIGVVDRGCGLRLHPKSVDRLGRVE